MVIALQSSTIALQSTNGFQSQKLQWASMSTSLAGQKGFSWLLRELGRGSWRKEKESDQCWHWLPVSVKVTNPFKGKSSTLQVRGMNYKLPPLQEGHVTGMEQSRPVAQKLNSWCSTVSET